MNDFELLSAWRAGDNAAGEVLVERHFDMLRRFFSGHLDEGVADLIQSTWLACIPKRDRIDDGKFRAFLLGVAYRELFMMLRTRRRRDRAFARMAAEPVFRTTPSQHVAERERRRLLHWALR